MMWYGDGYGWGGWVLMSLGMVAFWTLFAVLLVALVRGLRDDRGARRDQGAPPEPRPAARQVLDERFARGEIDAEEYKARRDLLESGR